MDVGTRVGARTHTPRGGAKRSTRSEAESCAGGLSWHNRPDEGELNQFASADVSSRSGCEYTKEDANDYRSDANRS